MWQDREGQRQRHVQSHVLEMVLSGGYGPSSWKAHVRSPKGILTRFDRAA